MSIHALIKNGDVKGATDYLAHYGKEIDPVRTEQMKELIGIAKVQAVSRQLVRSLPGTREQKITELNKLRESKQIDKDVHAATSQEIDKKIKEEKEKEEKENREFLDLVYTGVSKKRDMTIYDIEPALKQKLVERGLMKEAEKRIANGRTFDEYTWDKVLNLSDKKLEKLNRASFEKILTRLTPEHRPLAEAKWNQANGQEANPEHLMSINVEKFVQQTAKNAGVSLSEYKYYKMEADAEINKLRKLGKSISIEDIRGTIEKLALRPEYRSNWFSGRDANNPYAYGERFLASKYTKEEIEGARAALKLKASKPNKDGTVNSPDFIAKYMNNPYEIDKHLMSEEAKRVKRRREKWSKK